MANIIEVKNISTSFGSKVVHNDISFNIKEGEIFGLLGPSGCGKSTLIRQMLMLQEFDSGEVNILGFNTKNISINNRESLRKLYGVLFQSSALFSSINIFENIALPLREHTNLDEQLIQELVFLKLNMVGLKAEDAYLFPSDLSGGMKKKAALARALALEPKLLFLDEPSSGLDPISAREFDALLLSLKKSLGLSVVMVSHDLNSIENTLDTMIVLDDAKIVAYGTLNEVKQSQNDFIKRFFR